MELQGTCPNCGAAVSGDRDFCDSCGAYLRWDEPADEEQTAVLAPPERAPRDEVETTETLVAPMAPEAPAAETTQVEEDIVVTLRPAAVDRASVAPGSTTALVGFIRNQSGIVDHFDLELRGVPADWYTIAPAALDLVPYGAGAEGHEAEATVTVHPPRTCQATAGTRRVELVARSRSRPLERASNAVPLQIARFESFEGRLRPAHVRAKRTAEYVLPVRNQGNAPLVLVPSGEDDEGEVQFAFEPPRLEIPPCGEGRFAVRASAPVLRTAPERARNLSVHLEGGEQPLAGTAVFLQEPSVRQYRLGLWRVVLTLVAAVLLAAASFAHWTPTETGLCTNGPDSCLRYDTYLEGDLNTEAPDPGDLGEFTRVFNFGTSLGILTLLAAVLIVLGALKGRFAWFAGLLALAVLLAFAFTADEALDTGVWLGMVGAAAALGAALLATAAGRAR